MGATQSRKDSIGTTTAAFVAIITNSNTLGVIATGTVKNTGVTNGLTVRETVIDAFGNMTSSTVNVAPGNSYLLDPQSNFPPSLPLYVSYIVAVEDQVAGNHTTFEAHYTGFGSVS